MIDLDEIERRIPSRAAECAYCYRLATLVCPVSGTMVCEDHRDLAAREAISTGCTDAAMVPARHDAATMDHARRCAERLRRLCARGGARRPARPLRHPTRGAGDPRGGVAVSAPPSTLRRVVACPLCSLAGDR